MEFAAVQAGEVEKAREFIDRDVSRVVCRLEVKSECFGH